MAVTARDVLSALSAVKDPDLGRDIVSLGFVKDVSVKDGYVAFTIQLTTPACPVREQMKEEARRAVSLLEGVTQVDITMTSNVRSSINPASASVLAAGIKNVIPIASGKGGVGKSTVSANLAMALASLGAKVGLLDADVYGPSIPTLLGIRKGPEVDAQRRIIPVTHQDLKVISMGFFMKKEEAVIWRGPLLHKTVEQFLGGVVWGDLDYLICDMPPGTGDVQLSLCQLIPITGAVVVSTPQDVALNVARKAIEMFRKLNASVLGVVENMARYVCPKCGAEESIFGEGGARRIAKEMGIPFLGEVPLATPVRLASDAGEPIMRREPTSAPAQAFLSIAKALAAQVSIQHFR